MRRRLGAQLLAGLWILPGIVSVVFLIFSLLGDPARLVAGQRSDLATLEAIRQELGLDQPLYRQYLNYLNDVSPLGWLSAEQKASGNYRYLGPRSTGSVVVKLPYLGRSFQNRRPVAALYFERLPATALLAGLSLVLAVAIGIPMGVWAARHANTWVDRVLSVGATLGVSAPSFFVGILLVATFAVALYPYTGLPTGGYIRRLAVDGSHYRLTPVYLLLPVLTLGLRPLSLVFQLTRAGILSAMPSDYIRTARAKGLSETEVYWRHALPNTLGPIATSVSGWLASLLAGTFFVETIFDWPGIGKLTVDALYSSDYPVIAGVCVATGALFWLINLALNLLYPLLDPRIGS